MPRHIPYIIVTLTVGGITLFAWVVTHESAPTYQRREKPAESAHVLSLEEIPLITNVSKRETRQDGYTLNIEYPRLSLASRPDLAAQANDVIARTVEDAIDAFASDLKELAAIDPETDPETSSLPSVESSFTLRSTMMLVSPTIISVRFDSSGYIAGAAHPNSRSTALNYSLLEHTTLRPTDLFASSTDALPFLSRISREKLRTMFQSMSENDFFAFASAGTEPTLENFSSVAITPSGLVVIFTPYQVAPGTMGAIEVELPTSEFGALFTKEIREAMTLAAKNIEIAKPIE